MSAPPPIPALTPAITVVVHLSALEDHGQTSVGHRRVVPIIGGNISAPVNAEILAGGADWQIIMPDGSISIDSRYSARTSSGALLLLHARGIRAGSPEVLARLGRGDHVDPSEYYFRTTVTIETSDAELAWMQHRLFIAVGQRTPNAVTYTAYVVS